MNWFFIAFLATFLFSIVSIFDQYLVKKYSVGERGSGGLVLFSSLIGIFASIIIFVFTKNVFSISLLDKILLIGTGGLSISWIILYLYTMEIEEVSFIAIWFSLVPVFGYILGYFILGETLTQNQMIGSIIMILGVLFISIDFTIEEKHKFKFKPVLYMFFICLIISIISIIFKFVTIEGNYWVSSFWEYIGLGFFGLILYFCVPKYRKEFEFMNKTGGKKIFLLNIGSETITIIGNLLIRYSVLLVPVTLIYLVVNIQPVIILILIIFCTKFFPNIITEKLHKQVLIPKLIAIAFIIVGSIFLFI